MASRRLKPYRQGRLDGLCGLYALINALRLLLVWDNLTGHKTEYFAHSALRFGPFRHV